jgi:protein-disulfide reductase (glutathione)
MLRLCLIAVLHIAVLQLGTVQAVAETKAVKAIDWNESQIKWHAFEAGLKEAQRTRAPMLVLFYADWCPHCVAYSRLFRDPQIVALTQPLVMVKVNTDKSPEINTRYVPDGGYVPRTMVLKPDGSLITSIRGSDPKYKYFLSYDTKKELLAVLKSAASHRVSLSAH